MKHYKMILVFIIVFAICSLPIATLANEVEEDQTLNETELEDNLLDT